MRGDRARGQAADVGRRLLFSDDPDPRVLQGVFLALAVLDTGLRLVSGHVVLGPSWPTLGLAIALGVTVAAFVVPWGRLPHAAVGTLPVLDMAAIGLMRLDEVTSGTAALVVVPALWLGRQFGRRGALTAAVAGLVLMGLPTLAYLGLSGPEISRALMIPLVAGWAALALAIGLETVRASYDEADRGRVELSSALGTIDRQRRFAGAILDTVDVGLLLLDHDGTYRTMNRRHRDFMRLAFPEGHAGRAGQVGWVYAADGTTPLEREDMPTYRAARGEEFDDSRIWVGHDPLTRRALSVSARAVRDDEGAFAGAALAYKDVTDFMRALRVKDEFVASVSHELRTPLTSIMGYVDLLLEEPELQPEHAAQLEVVARNTDRLRRLVADLLHTAQMDEGPLHVVRTAADLSEIVRDSVAAATSGARAQHVELEVDVPDTLPAVVDGQRMAQVVDNLVSNAVKYTPDGGRVRVELGVDGSRVELVVRDTGIGIEPHDRERLFTRFFRARDAEERSIQGVGLGLSITKQIVESHGGRIEVESEAGRGSVFRVRIPLEVDQPAIS